MVKIVHHSTMDQKTREAKLAIALCVIPQDSPVTGQRSVITYDIAEFQQTRRRVIGVAGSQV
jgi:hypothetical protein